MLGKLIKHEFRATGRILLPLLGAELLLAVLAGFSVRGLGRVENMGILGVMYVTTLVVFFLGLFALSVVAFVLMIQRFYKNLLRDEGYLAMTLPVSVDEHICAKLIVSYVWFTAVAILSVLAMLVMMGVGSRISFIGDLNFQEIFGGLRDAVRLIGAGNLWLFALEGLVLSFLGTAAACLRCYSALAIGHSAADHKLLLSFVAYIVIGIVLSLVRNWLMLGLLPALDPGAFLAGITSAAQVHACIGAGILAAALYCALFYFLTRWFMKNKLNLA